MKEIIIGKKLEKVDDEMIKSRMINIKDNKILICIYDNCYMLPGGKIDSTESTIDALKREILEELGNSLNEDKLENFKIVIHNIKNYQSRHHQNRINKCTKTYYYIYNGDIDLNNQRNLSQNEIDNNVQFKYVSIPELIEYLSNTSKMNEKERVFAKELLIVINELIKNYQMIDLHTHTLYSDGDMHPQDLIKRAKEKNIRTIAITDHDTVLGLNEIDFDNYKGIDIIPGIELSIKRPFGRMHILGLNIDYKNKKLNDRLQELRNDNIQNLKNIVEYLKNNKINFIEEDLNAIYNRIGNIGRPDIAKLLIKYNYVKTVQEAFDKYLIEAFNATRKNSKALYYDEAIKLILDANGIPILAHPNSLELNKTDFEELLKDMVEVGLMGIETMHSHMNYEERNFYQQMVDKYNLLYSAGSDFHGKSVKPDIELGSGNNNMYALDASVLKYIKRGARN